MKSVPDLEEEKKTVIINFCTVINIHCKNAEEVKSTGEGMND